MCQTTQNPLMVNTTRAHIERLKKILPNVAEFSDDLFKAVKEHIFAPILFFSALATAVDEIKKGDHSSFFGNDAAQIPFTVGSTSGERYRTRIMELLHKVFPTTNMAGPTMKAVDEVLDRHGVALLFMCCCNGVVGTREKIEELRGSQEHLDFDKVSTWLDGISAPIRNVRSLKDIEGTQLLDVSASGAEQELLEKIEMVVHFVSKAETYPDSTTTPKEVAEIAERMAERAQAA